MDLTAQIELEDLLPRPSELEMALMAGVLICGVKATAANVYPLALKIYSPREFTETAARTVLDRMRGKGYLRSVPSSEPGRGRNPGYYRLTMPGRKSMTASIQFVVRVWKAVENRL